MQLTAYVTSVGERTTDVCVWALKRNGWKVEIMSEREPWPDKYARFVEIAAHEAVPCLRVDADQILGKIATPQFMLEKLGDGLFAQFRLFDLYQMAPFHTSPLFYLPEALQQAHKLISREQMDETRPEASIMRHPSLDPHRRDHDEIIGIHGFYQDFETVERAKANKRARGQMDRYDFALADKLTKLCK